MGNQNAVKINANGTFVKKILTKSAMAVCVATSGTFFINQYAPKPIKPKAMAHNHTPEQKVNFIEKTFFAYTKPKAIAKPFYIQGSNEGAISMQNPLEHNSNNDFEFSLAAIDSLDKVEVLPAKSTKIVKVKSIVRDQGKIIEPDEDDFSFNVFDLDIL